MRMGEAVGVRADNLGEGGREGQRKKTGLAGGVPKLGAGRAFSGQPVATGVLIGGLARSKPLFASAGGSH